MPPDCIRGLPEHVVAMFPSTDRTFGSDFVMFLAAAACIAAVLFIINSLASCRTRAKAAACTSSSEKRAPSIHEKHDYTNVFPPVHQGCFSNLAAGGLDVRCLDLAATPKPLLRLDADYRSSDPACFNFSGFNIAHIKALGDFPDYEKLSGVSLPTPLPDFDVDKALPRPYRPFRWSYHQTMSLTKMDADFWIELESTYRERIAQRQTLFRDNGNHVLESLPGSELACKELMEMVVQFLVARYPKQFSLSGCLLTNNILNICTDLSAVPPLEVLLLNVPEDFGIMLRDPETGRYVLRAGVICSTLGWKLSEKMGLGLADIHKIVPDYKEKMELSMDRFFTKMPTDKPIQRGSWSFEVGKPLFLPSDDPEFAIHRSSQKPGLKPSNINLRVDWQTLRRLPLSGAIIFNFKALFTPLPELRDEPYIPSLALKVLEEGKESLLQYKGTWYIEHIAKPALRDYVRFQVESGMVEKEWAVQTLPEAPFFKDWKRKWAVC